MDLTTITVAQFKAQFTRDFPYFSAIQYDPTAVYNTGDEVFYPAANLFYIALVDGLTNVAPNSDATKWCKYADSVDNWVQDSDITRAFGEAQVVFNQALLSGDAQVILAYLYVTAYYLVVDLKTAMAGVNSTGAFPMSGRTVGSVSESYSVPAAYQNDPLLALYTQNGYGMKYLSFILPGLRGNVVAVPARANP